MDVLSVRDLGGVPTLYINDEPQPAMLHLTDKATKDLYEGIDPFTPEFRQAGFRLMSVLADDVVTFDSAWDPAAGTFRREAFEGLSRLKKYVSAYPDVKFLIRTLPEPRGKDSAWLRMHPEEWEVNEPKAKPFYPCPSYASKKWLNDAKRYLTALMGALEDLGLSDNLMGLVIGGADSCEWVKVGPMEDWASDFSPPMQAAFGEWLKEKYGDEDALRAAWQDPLATFFLPVPSPDMQSETALYLMKDPLRQKRAIDYFTFLAHLVAQDIIQLCECAKRAGGSRHLMGVFYGYLQEMVWNNGFFGQGDADADVAAATVD